MAKQLNEKGFTDYALKKGWSQDQIDTAINNYKVQHDFFTGLVQKYGDVIPAVMSVAGAIGGGILTIPEGIAPGATGGAIIGYAGGKATENTLKDLVGLKSTNADPTQGLPAVINAGGKAIEAGSVAYTVGSLADAGLKKASGPDMRNNIINSLPEDQQYISREDATAVIDKYANNEINKNDPEVQKSAQILKDALFGGSAAPGNADATGNTVNEQTYSKDKVHLTDFYDNLSNWENKYRAYNDNGKPVTTGTSGVVNDISTNLRQLANDTGGRTLKLANNLMAGKIKSSQALSFMDQIKRFGSYGARFLAFKMLYNEIRGQSSQKKTW
jgi:hypothetical protein